jgi:hypothetical protein
VPQILNLFKFYIKLFLGYGSLNFIYILLILKPVLFPILSACRCRSIEVFYSDTTHDVTVGFRFARWFI